MADNESVGAEGQDPVGGGDDPKGDPKPEGAASSGRTFTEAEMKAEAEALAAKRSEAAERKAKAAEKEAARLREKAMTDDEKKAEELRKEGRTAAEQEFQAKEREWGIERALLSERLPDGMQLDDLKLMVESRMQRDNIDDPKQAVEAVKAAFPQLFQSKPAGPGGGGGRVSEKGPTTEWTPEAIDEVIRRNEYDKYEAEIKAYQQKKAGGVTTEEPGRYIKRPTREGGR